MHDAEPAWSRGSPSPAVGESPAAWRAHWAAIGQPWRTEPEIDGQRQRMLAERRALGVDLEGAMFAFEHVEPKLTRADLEWLLETHDGGRGPVDWREEGQRTRVGLDLRGADLRGVDLGGLPLARLRGGLAREQWRTAPAEQLEAAAIHLEGAYLEGAHLEGAELPGAHLEGAVLNSTHLADANLGAARLEGATLHQARLDGAYLGSATLTRATLDEANLASAYLVGAQLTDAYLPDAQLDGAILWLADLHGADLAAARLGHADLTTARLAGANLASAAFDTQTNLTRAVLSDKPHGAAALADVVWGGARLAVVDWGCVRVLGDERVARTRRAPDGGKKTRAARLVQYQAAVRANRQLAAALRARGLHEDAARFAYRAEGLQRAVWWWQRRPLRYLASLLLAVSAGYGYRPLRTLLAYLILIAGFAAGFAALVPSLQALPFPRALQEALILSATSFHGRGLLAPASPPGDAAAVLAAVEAALGLLFEIGVIATYARRRGP